MVLLPTTSLGFKFQRTQLITSGPQTWLHWLCACLGWWPRVTGLSPSTLRDYGTTSHRTSNSPARELVWNPFSLLNPWKQQSGPWDAPISPFLLTDFFCHFCTTVTVFLFLCMHSVTMSGARCNTFLLLLNWTVQTRWLSVAVMVNIFRHQYSGCAAWIWCSIYGITEAHWHRNSDNLQSLISFN